jgi:hypothetical protein
VNALLPSAPALFVAWAKTNTALNAIQAGRVATKLNATLPATRVQRIGGIPESPQIDQPILQVECWAADEVTAERLARTYVAELDTFRHRAPTGQVFTYSFESGPFYSPDDPALSQNVRYLFSIRLVTTA